LGGLTITVEGARGAADRRARILLYLVWLLLVLWFASRHVFWRDEIRAFSIALSGDSLLAMLRGVQGEGHPAIWYLLLRGAHALVPVREVLPAVAAIVAALAMALLVFRSPFRPWLLALMLFGAAGLFEYAVSARNYGISLIFLFAVADLYPRWRDRGVTIGLLLALLCNTNVPSVFLAAALMLFWFVELIGEDGLRWTPKWRSFWINGLVAAAGAATAFVTVYPPANDAAVNEEMPSGVLDLVTALLDPAYTLQALAPHFLGGSGLVAALLSLVIFASLAGLARAPAAFLSSLAALLAFELFFLLIYPGQYRHHALLLFYLVAMYWLVAQGRGGRWPERWRVEERLGRMADHGRAGFVMLLALQLPNAVQLAAADAMGIAYGNARALAALLERERLQNAILIAQPDVLLETMPYYAPNPLYFTRQQEFARIARFSKAARVDLDLGQLLDRAEAVGARYRRPVVILMQHETETRFPTRIEVGYVGTYSTTPEQARRLQASTRRIAVLQPAISDETYIVYLLESGPKPSA
jgi:hypothetical protein